MFDVVTSNLTYFDYHFFGVNITEQAIKHEEYVEHLNKIFTFPLYQEFNENNLGLVVTQSVNNLITGYNDRQVEISSSKWDPREYVTWIPNNNDLEGDDAWCTCGGDVVNDFNPCIAE